MRTSVVNMSWRWLMAALLTLGIALFALGNAQQLQVVWMGWPEEEVLPLFEGFEAEEPGVSFQIERLPFGQLLQTLEVRLAARTAVPDIYIVDGPLTASYAVRGHLLDLTPYLEPYMDGFTQAAIDQGTFDGKMYSAPIASSMAVLLYNKDLFDAAGLDYPPADPDQRWTWDQVVEAGQQLTDPASNTWGFLFEINRPFMLFPLPQSNNAQVIGDDWLTASGYVDSPAFVEAMQWYADTFNVWQISPSGVFDNVVAQEIFAGGNAAMMTAGTWMLDILPARFPDLNWGVAPFPYFAGGTPVTPTGSFHIGVNPRGQNVETAIRFVQYMVRDDTIEQWFNLRTYPPVRTAVWDRLDVFDTEAWNIVRYELNHTAVPRPRTPGYREYEDILLSAIQDIQTGVDVQARLQRAAQQIDRELEKYR